MEIFSVGYALLATQSALLGIVAPSLRAVVVDVCKESKLFYLRFYYDGDISESLIDLWQCAVTEASADLGPHCRLDDGIERLDYPQKIPLHGRYAYLRKEPVILESADDFEDRLPVKREVIQFQNEIGQFISPIDESAFSTRWGIAHVYQGIDTAPARPECYPIPIVPVAYAQLSIQRALLGTVVPELAVIVVDVEDSLLYIRFYYEGKVRKATLEEWELVMTKVWADLGPNYVLDGQIESVVYPQPVFLRGRCAYRRLEMKDRGLWPSVAIDPKSEGSSR